MMFRDNSLHVVDRKALKIIMGFKYGGNCLGDVFTSVYLLLMSALYHHCHS